MSLAMKSFDVAAQSQDSRREIIKKALMPSGVLVCDLMFSCSELLWHKGTAECPENQTKENVLPGNLCKRTDGPEQVVNCRELIQFPS